jgi:hypothetical protein
MYLFSGEGVPKLNVKLGDLDLYSMKEAETPQKLVKPPSTKDKKSSPNQRPRHSPQKRQFIRAPKSSTADVLTHDF